LAKPLSRQTSLPLLPVRGKKFLSSIGDLGLANIDIMLGINPALTLKDVVLGNLHLRNVIISTKGGFDLIPASSGVRETAQLLFEKIQIIKDMLLDTGAGIAEVVLQFNLLAGRNIVVINRELTSLADAYAMVKVMYQVFGRQSFSVITNNITSEQEGLGIFKNIDTISRRFLGFPLNYLGYVLQDNAVGQSLLRQEIAVMSSPRSRIAVNFSQMGRAVSRFKESLTGLSQFILDDSFQFIAMQSGFFRRQNFPPVIAALHNI
jgi:flagellar biosynthesis protein FlhG